MLGSETAETNLRTLLLPCYLQLLGVHVGERDGAADGGGGGCCCVNMRSLRGPDFGPLILEELGSETAETNLWTLLLPCYLQLLGVDVGERD